MMLRGVIAFLSGITSTDFMIAFMAVPPVVGVLFPRR
jgi:hypothetical protein